MYLKWEDFFYISNQIYQNFRFWIYKYLQVKIWSGLNKIKAKQK